MLNAVEVVNINAEITIEVEVSDTEPKQIDFNIIDKGPGLSEELISKVYEPFYTSRAKGTGLGLAVVRAVADAHDGETWVKNSIEKGTVFTLRIPAYNTERSI